MIITGNTNINNAKRHIVLTLCHALSSEMKKNSANDYHFSLMAVLLLSHWYKIMFYLIINGILDST